MAWIELHQSLPGHRKTMRLRRALKLCQAQAVGHLCMLWLWCLDNCPDGNTANLDDCEIAEAAGYTGKDPSVFVLALREAGFIDPDGYVHDWNTYAGKLIDKREQNAQRMRDRRARAEHVQRTCSARAEHVQQMCIATVPNPTVPNPTVPNQGGGGGNARAHDPEPWNPYAGGEPPSPTVETYIANELAPMTPGNIEQLTALQEAGMQDDAILMAVDIAAANNRRTWAYTHAILRRWEQARIFTAGAAKADEAENQRKRAPPGRASPQPALSKAEQFMELARRYEEAGE